METRTKERIAWALFAASAALSVAAVALSFATGHGFDPAAIRRGSGLQGMADRLDAVGGTLDVRSEIGVGTTVAGRLPVRAG